MNGEGKTVRTKQSSPIISASLGTHLVWINVTTNTTAERIARQITEAYPWDGAPRYLTVIAIGSMQLRAMGIRDKPIAPASPWQNRFAERLISSIRRECLDHMIVSDEARLRGC